MYHGFELEAAAITDVEMSGKFIFGGDTAFVNMELSGLVWGAADDEEPDNINEPINRILFMIVNNN